MTASLQLKLIGLATTSRCSRSPPPTRSPLAAGASRKTTNDHRRPAMTTSLKLKLIGLATTIALLVLPAADALANRSWG